MVPVAFFFLVIFLTGLTATNADWAPVTIVDLAVISASCFLLARFPPVSLWTDRSGRKLVLGAGVLFLIVFIKYFLAWSHPYFLAPARCTSMAALIPKIECMLYLDFSQNYGLRQIVSHFAAGLVFVAGYAVAVHRKKWVFWSLLPAAIWVGYSLLALMQIVDTSLFSMNFVGGREALSRDIVVVSNAGWLWPLLTPSFAFILGVLFTGDASRLRSLFVCLVFGYGVVLFANGQRGSFLILALFFGLFCFLYIRARFGLKISKKSMLRAYLVTGLLFTVVLAFFLTGMHYKVAHFFGLYVKRQVFSVSHIRVEMWLRGLGHFLENPLFGTGYASWMHIDPRIKFPTAHNLWIQTLVEHGLVFFVPLCFTVYTFARVLLSAKGFRAWGRGAFFLVGVLCISLFQELDHLNTIYFQVSLFGGLLCGLAYRGSKNEGV